MNASQTGTKPRFFRRNYLIDKPTQLRVVGMLLGGLAGLGIMYVVALYVFFPADSPDLMDPLDVRAYLLQVCLLTFTMSATMIVALGILLTHRFVGPVHVLRQALKGMADGDYGRRLTLRRSDFLQDVADGLASLRGRWVERERQVAATLHQVERSIAQGDDEGALAAIKSLKDGVVVQVAPGKPVTPAPRPTVTATPAA